MSEQLEIDFAGNRTVPPASFGLDAWRANRLREMEAISRKVGVPVGRRAEVCLSQGPVVRGVVQFAEELLWNDAKRSEIVFRIGEVTFSLGEIESVVCLDDVDPGQKKGVGR